MNEIILGDCLDKLKGVPDKSFQMTFADPPFNLDKKYIDSARDQMTKAKYLAWCGEWLQEMVRVTKDNGTIFVHHIPRFLMYFAATLDDIAEFKHWISWDAPSGPMGKSLQPSHYGILYYGKTEKPKFFQLRHAHKYCIRCAHISKDWGGKKDRIPVFGSLTSDCWTDIHRIKHGQHEAMDHPCILPVHLMERLILMATDPGDAVLDLFMGTGTTAIAAKRLGRDYFGFELSPKYHETAVKRITAEKDSGKIGNSYVSVFKGEVLTIRDQDWLDLAPFFDIPEDRKQLDVKKLQLKNGVLNCDKKSSSRVRRAPKTQRQKPKQEEIGGEQKSEVDKKGGSVV